MLPYQLDDLDEAKLQALCDQDCPESDTLDFKREPSSRPEEIQKDVCAMANTSGGDIVIGVEESDSGGAGRLFSLSGSGDQLILKYRSILDAIEPRIHNVEMRAVPFDAGGFALAIRVPTSFEAPHSYPQGQARRFVMRNGARTIDMTYDQLKTAFARKGQLAQQAKAFLAERDVKLAANGLGRCLKPGPSIAVHCLPISGLAGTYVLDVQRLYAREFTRFAAGHVVSGSAGRVLNLDGLQVYSHGHEGIYFGITNLFRNGVVETAIPVGVEYRDELFLHAGDIAMRVRSIVRNYLDFAKTSNIAGPAVVRLAAFHTTGYALRTQNSVFEMPGEADRPHLQLPEYWIDDLQTVRLDDVVRPMLDLFCQCFDALSCPDYDGEGKWIGNPC